MRFLLLGLLAVACSADDPHYPIEPGGGGGAGGNGSGSNAVPADAGSDRLRGVVCVLPDPRDFTTCSATGLAGMTVSLPGVGSATTADDGTFAIALPTGTDLVWTISGSNVMPSMMGFSTSAVLYAITPAVFTDLLNANGIVPDPTQGVILGNVLRGGSALGSATVVASPIGVYPSTFYAKLDDTQDWPLSSTDAALGSFMMAGFAPGVEALTATPAAGSAEVLGGVLVGSGAVTFVSVQL